jgi:hypothetical protein
MSQFLQPLVDIPFVLATYFYPHFYKRLHNLSIKIVKRTEIYVNLICNKKACFANFILIFDKRMC